MNNDTLMRIKIHGAYTACLLAQVLLPGVVYSETQYFMKYIFDLFYTYFYLENYFELFPLPLVA